MLKKNWPDFPSERRIVDRKKSLRISMVQMMLMPKLNEKLYAARLEVAHWYVEMAKNEDCVVASFGVPNFHEVSGLAPGLCFEVLEGGAKDVPPEVRFAELAKETSTQETEVMCGMACCPCGPIYFEHFEWRGGTNRRNKPARDASQKELAGRRTARWPRSWCPRGRRPFC
jgi:hypothetical protein